jgi:hypothetical protein
MEQIARFESIDTTSVRNVPVVWGHDTVALIRGSLQLAELPPALPTDSNIRRQAGDVFNAAGRVLGDNVGRLGPLGTFYDARPQDTVSSGMPWPLLSSGRQLVLMGEYVGSGAESVSRESALVAKMQRGDAKMLIRVTLERQRGGLSTADGSIGQLWLGQPLRAFWLN